MVSCLPGCRAAGGLEGSVPEEKGLLLLVKYEAEARLANFTTFSSVWSLRFPEHTYTVCVKLKQARCHSQSISGTFLLVVLFSYSPEKSHLHVYFDK